MCQALYSVLEIQSEKNLPKPLSLCSDVLLGGGRQQMNRKCICLLRWNGCYGEKCVKLRVMD